MGTTTQFEWCYKVFMKRNSRVMKIEWEDYIPPVHSNDKHVGVDEFDGYFVRFKECPFEHSSRLTDNEINASNDNCDYMWGQYMNIDVL